MRIKLLIFIILISTPVFSQEVMKLSFQEAIKVGLQNNISLKQEQNNLTGAKSNQLASLMDYATPNINANGRMERNIGNSFNEQLGENVTGQRDFISSSISANYNIFSGLNEFNTLKQSRKLEDAQMFNIKWTKSTVINNVALQYLNALLSQELLKIAQNNLILRQQQVNKISEQVQLGSLAEVELINQQYQVKNAELQVIRATANLKNNYAGLLQILQLEPTTDLELVEPNWSTQVIIDEDTGVEPLIANAIQNRADFKQSLLLEEAASYRTKAVRGLYSPSLSIYFAYGSAYNFIYPSATIEDPSNRDFQDQYFEDNVQQVYGLSLSIPILNGFSTRNAVMQAKITHDNRQLANEELMNTIKSQVQSAYQDYQAAVLGFEASKSQLEAAELSFKLEEERYFLGASDMVAYTQANQNLVAAQADYAQAYYTLAFQEILMKYALGTLTPEDIPN